MFTTMITIALIIISQLKIVQENKYINKNIIVAFVHKNYSLRNTYFYFSNTTNIDAFSK